ncbi:phage tail tape measure protein [Bacillus swezeyi]|uniref:phage tail tape measure protein n=1 Tax=Bacillus swezeyi TaxID=1925020 RepID=UPI0027DCCA7F|nr:phage tail tape measure protein [Bacillus swezeyi]
MADGRIVIDAILNRSDAERGLSDLQRSFSNVSQKMASVGATLTKAVTLPLVGAATMATKFAIDQETAFAKVSTLLDSSKTDYNKYKDTIRDASNEMGVSFGEYSEAVYQSISAGVDQGKAIKFTADAAKLAKGGFTDTATAVDIMTTALNAYGMEASEAGKISDLLINTQNQGKTTVDELSASMGTVIPVAKANNVSIEQLSTGYAVLTKNGIATAEAGTYIRSMFGELGKSGTQVDKILRKKTGKSFSELQKEGKTTADVLNILQKEADNSGLQLSDMFGSVEAGSAAMVLAKDGGEEFDEILKTMGDSAGATDEAFKKMNETTGVKLQKALISLQNSGAKIGDVLLPMLAKVAEGIAYLADKFGNLNPVVQKVVVAIGILVAAIGPLMFAVFSIAPGFVSLAGALNMSTAALLKLMGRIALFSGVFAILAVGIVLAITHFDELREKATEVGKSLLKTLKPAIETIQRLFEGVAKVLTGDLKRGTRIIEDILPKPVATFIVKGLDMIREGFLNVKQAIEDAFNGDFSGVAEYIPKIIGILTGGIPSLIITGLQFLPALAEGIQANLPMILETAQTVIQTFVDNFVENLPVFLQAGLDIVTNLLQGITQSLPVIIEAVLTLLNTIIEQITIYLPMIVGAGVLILTNLINGIVQALPQIITAVTQAMTVLTETITELLPIIIQAGITILMALIDGIIQSLPQIIQATLTLILAIANAVIENLPTIIDAGIKILTSLIDGIIKMLPQLIQMAIYLVVSVAEALIKNLPKIIDAGIKLLLALVDGIIKMLPQLIEAAVTIIIKLAEGLIRNMPRIMEAGGQLLMALIKGLMSLVGELIGAGFDLIGELAGAFGSGIGDMFGIGADIVNGLLDGMGSMLGNVLDTAADIGNSIKDKFKDIFNIHSPSRWMRDDIGVNLMKGYEVGVDQKKQSVLRKSAETAEWMKPDISIMDFMPETGPSTAASGYTNSVTNNNNTPVTINMEYYGDGSQQDANNFVDMIDKAFGERLRQNNFMVGVRGNA